MLAAGWAVFVVLGDSWWQLATAALLAPRRRAPESRPVIPPRMAKAATPAAVAVPMPVVIERAEDDERPTRQFPQL